MRKIRRTGPHSIIRVGIIFISFCIFLFYLSSDVSQSHSTKSPTLNKPKTLPPTITTVVPKDSFQTNSIQAKTNQRILIFTMDTINEQNWLRSGGPGGEILFRSSLERSLLLLGYSLTVVRSDAQFFEITADTRHEEFSKFIFDIWTYYSPGYLPRKFVPGREDDVYILDFFATAPIPPKIHPSHILTLITHPATKKDRTFLGFIMNSVKAKDLLEKQNFGMLWSKQLQNPRQMDWDNVLKAVKETGVELHFSFQPPNDSNFKFDSLLSKEEYLNQLGRSKFLLGVGDPLSGPSALEAISRGCLLIIPKYSKSRMYDGLPFETQHDFAIEIAPKNRVCVYQLHGNYEDLKLCLKKAMENNFETYEFPELTEESHLKRVKMIFPPLL